MSTAEAILRLLRKLQLRSYVFFDDFNEDITPSKFSTRIQLQKKQQQVEVQLDTLAVHFDYGSKDCNVEKAGKYVAHSKLSRSHRCHFFSQKSSTS